MSGCFIRTEFFKNISNSAVYLEYRIGSNES